MPKAESAHDHAAKAFAHTLADKLDKARNEHRYGQLVLVAEPRFLGMLREALDKGTAALVSTTVNKDLANLELEDLAEHLRPFISNSHHQH